jgi:hypothetical protein
MCIRNHIFIFLSELNSGKKYLVLRWLCFVLSVCSEMHSKVVSHSVNEISVGNISYTRGVYYD